MMVLIPTADLKVQDPPEPHPTLTRALSIPVIRINVNKYASLIRGDRSCQRHGSPASHCKLFT